jgi:hypothetical protein
LAKISTYVIDGTIVDADKVIGSDANNALVTKNYTVGDLVNYFAASIGNNFLVPYNNATQDVNLGLFSFSANNLSLTGTISLSGSQGLPGQVPISNGPGNDTTWGYYVGTQTLQGVLDLGYIATEAILLNNANSRIILDTKNIDGPTAVRVTNKLPYNNTAIYASDSIHLESNQFAYSQDISIDRTEYGLGANTVTLKTGQYNNQDLILPGVGGALIVSVNGIFADLSGNVIIPSGDDATTSDITSDLQVGGIDAQELVPAGTTLQQFAELLLLTTFFPTLIAPSFSLSNNTGTVETGSIVSPLLTFTFNRGSINGALSAGVWNPALFQNFRAGASSSYTLNGTTQLGNTLSVTSYTVLNGSNTFSGTVNYILGPQPLDSEGNNFGNPFPAGTSPSQSTSFTGIYPYYYYKSGLPITPADMQTAIGNGTATKVVGGSTGTLFIPYNVSGQYMSIAYPNTSTAKTKYFVTDLDKGDLGSLTSPFDLGTVLNCSSSLTYWSNIPYRIHVSPILTNSNPIIELRNP